jgi:hypothetical protein
LAAIPPQTSTAGILEAPATPTRHDRDDARSVATLERLWHLWRQGDADTLAAALADAPVMVRDRFNKDRAQGRTSA